MLCYIGDGHYQKKDLSIRTNKRNETEGKDEVHGEAMTRADVIVGVVSMGVAILAGMRKIIEDGDKETITLRTGLGEITMTEHGKR